MAAVYYLERSGRGGRLFPALCFSFAFLIPFAELEKQRWEFSGAGGEWWPAFSIGDKEQKLEEVGNDCGDSSGVRHMRDGFVFLLKVFASCCFLNFSTLWPYLSSLPLARYTRPQFFLTKLVVSKWWGAKRKRKPFVLELKGIMFVVSPVLLSCLALSSRESGWDQATGTTWSGGSENVQRWMFIAQG